MTINIELLDRTLAHIEAHPGELRQETWRCRTGMCFAGWACELAGGEWVEGPEDDLSDYLTPIEGDPPRADPEYPTYVPHRARRVLGLTDDQAERLFSVRNSLDDLRRIVAQLKAEADLAGELAAMAARGHLRRTTEAGA